MNGAKGVVQWLNNSKKIKVTLVISIYAFKFIYYLFIILIN
jgi:hypothetical protein